MLVWDVSGRWEDIYTRCCWLILAADVREFGLAKRGLETRDSGKVDRRTPGRRVDRKMATWIFSGPPVL